MPDSKDEARILEHFLHTGRNACHVIHVVGCPMTRCTVPEVNCAACEHRCDHYLCPELGLPCTDSICARCSKDNDGHDCLWCRAERAPTPEKKAEFLARRSAEARPGCRFPKAIQVAAMLVPSPAVVQELASALVQPVTAPPPPDFFPAVRMNPVTRATELEAKDPPNGDDEGSEP